MQMRVGSKPSEMGAIPGEWSVPTLGVCLTGGPSYGINAPAVPLSDGLPTYLRITDITEDGRISSEQRVSVNDTRSGAYYLREGDIVLARTGASVGKSYLYDPDDGPLVFAGFLIRVHPDPQRLLSAFVAAYLTTDRYWDWVRLMSTRSGQPGINGREYGQLPVPVPPLAEQRAIAEALGAVDSLTESLVGLIHKKRSLTQSVAQELLTGQIRLPGFNDGWKSTKVDAIGSTYGGLTGKSKADFGSGSARYIPFLNVLRNPVIDTDDLAPVHVTAMESQHRARRGDLFFNGSSETPEEVGMGSVLLDDVEDLYLNSFCFGFTLRDGAKADGHFLAYLFRSQVGRDLMYSLAQGATRYNLSKTAFLNLSTPLPDLDEQRAIAAALTDMDAEIAALEARLAKTRDLKRAMAQELLAGRTRLV